jgi:hypothetical protein
MGKIRVNRWIIENQCWFEDVATGVMVALMIAAGALLLAEIYVAVYPGGTPA